MTTIRDTEAQLVRDLRDPANLGLAERGPVELIETHCSLVLLTRSAVFKVKRERDYGFLDYSTVAKRRECCEREVELNRRASVDVYLGVLPVYRDARGYSLTRLGKIADWAVHMRRLPDDRSARAMLERGALTEDDVVHIAHVVAAFLFASRDQPPDPDALVRNYEQNFEQVEPFADDILPARELADLIAAQRAWLASHQALLATRQQRDGHGDLRLEHVYLLDRGVQLIDCVEFADRFRISDPGLDVAFFAMELHWKGRPDLARRFMAHFAETFRDPDLEPLASGYISYRAFVRAKVACLIASDPTTEAARAQQKRTEATELFTLARDALRPH